MQILFPFLVETAGSCHRVEGREECEELFTQSAVVRPEAVIAHPSVLKPLLTFFQLPQKVPGHRVLSHCVLLNS